jgi:DNA repair photolyase
MTAYARYKYALSLTSQFYFCGLPLRLDPYGDCLFSCQYCFAAARGGMRQSKGLQVADPDHLVRRFEGRTLGSTSVLDELIAVGQSIHVGGMSDPLPPIEAELGITKQLLSSLRDLQHPAVISTKSDLIVRDDYLNILHQGQFVVQISFGTRSDELAAEVEVGVVSPSRRKSVLERLIAAGVPTAARLQPVLPGREAEALEFVSELGELGVKHVGIEHLKLPIEKWSGTQRLSRALGKDLPNLYAAAHSVRVGREWILPVEERLPLIVEGRARAHSMGMSFGAADTDLLPLSDSSCCCSGIDRLLPESRSFEHNYLGAIRRADADGLVQLSVLEHVWAPEGSIAEMVNSRSRLPVKNGKGAGVRDYIRANWNGRSNGCSPQMFYGVEASLNTDQEGHMIYEISNDLKDLMGERVSGGAEDLCG